MHSITDDGIRFDPPNVIQLIVIMSLGIAVVASNYIVIYVIVRTRSLRSQSGVFMASGALNDSTIGVTCLVVFPYLIKGQFSDVFCSILGYFAFSAIQTRLGILTFMSVDKCLTINYPFTYPMKMSVTRVGVLILVIFVQAYLFCLPVLLHSHTYRQHAFVCEMNWLTPSIYPYVAQTYIYVQLVIMTSCHVNLYLIARKQLKKMKELGQGSVKLEKKNETSKKGWVGPNIKSQLRGIKTLFLLVGIFYICWITYIVAQIMYPTFTRNLVQLHVINFLSIWLGFLNLSCNCILYYLTNKSFSSGFKRYVLHKKNTVDTEMSMSLTA
ncbi:unnamed protein product [Owenia fusiformis]|uniref:Uncharacterized protein n=1 Tax=Owenia fusiformis TaxID=6347 RepID=A0A8J1TBR7_OWEFU|nr:unnamed protein product [Owenia fusiformis]